jgi:hypothetical protein
MKHFSKGFLEGLGIAAATGIATLLSLLIPSVRQWVFHGGTGLSHIGGIAVTIFLFVVCVVLLVLLVRSRIAYRGLQKRARDGTLTIGDLADMKVLMAATDTQSIIQKRLDEIKSKHSRNDN